MAYIFYDTETTGADRCFDQILQFAAVLTDDDLNVIDNFEIRSRLLPHIVPSPGAMLVTGVDVDQLYDPALPSHFEMSKRIHQVITDWSPATIVGYNSLSFDEELLRRAFYSSLLPIYLTNTTGNSRLDILPLAVATHAFSPEALEWPINEKGGVSFKLDRLAPANGFDHEHAHDALADVLATIHLARLIRNRALDIWIAAVNTRTKLAASEFVDREPLFVATTIRFSRCLSRMVAPLGVNPENSSELLTLDLRQDPALLAAMSDDDLTAHLRTSPRPVQSLKLNACPLFVPPAIAGIRAGGYELGMAELGRRANLVRDDHRLRERLTAAALAMRAPYAESPHVEEQIYGGFYSRADQALIDEFHHVDWPRRLELSDRFADPRLKTLSRRLVYCEAPEIMPARLRREYRKAVAARIHTRKETTGKWTTLDDAIEEAEGLLAEVGDGRKDLIHGHLARLTARREEAGRVLADMPIERALVQ